MNLYNVLLAKKLNSGASIGVGSISEWETLFASKLGGGAEKIVTILGNPLSFVTKKAQTAVSTKISMEPIQEGSGDPSPTNIRPISGRTGVEIDGCGKNLFNKNMVTENSWIKVNTAEIEPQNGYYVSDYIPVEEGAEIVCNQRGASRCAYFDKQKNPIAYFSWASDVFIPAYSGYIRVTDSNANLDTLQIERGSTATAYEPYQSSNEITISFGETVYGGTLDLTSGVLTVDRAIVDLGTLSWTRGSAASIYFFASNVSGKKFGNKIVCEALSTQDITSVALLNNNSIMGHPNEGRTEIYTRADEYETAEDFKTAMNGVQLCYELATPLTIQLTPEKVRLLKGSNTLWTDGDSIELTYKGLRTVADGIKDEFKKHFDIELSDENAEFVADYWKDYPTYKFYCFEHTNGYQYIYISNFIDETQFLNGSVYVSGSDGQYFSRTVYKESSSSFEEWYGPAQYAGQLDNYHDQFVLPNYTDYENSLN